MSRGILSLDTKNTGFTLIVESVNIILEQPIMVYYEGGDYMTGKEVVNLIQKLEEEGMTAEKIIEIIKYIETAEPKAE